MFNPHASDGTMGGLLCVLLFVPFVFIFVFGMVVDIIEQAKRAQEASGQPPLIPATGGVIVIVAFIATIAVGIIWATTT